MNSLSSRDEYMDKSEFPRPRDIPVIYFLFVLLVACSQVSSRGSTITKQSIEDLTPTKRSSSTSISISAVASTTPVATRKVDVVETPELLTPTSAKSPTQFPNTRTPDLNLIRSLTNDLLFVSNGTLVQWDSENDLLKPIIKVVQNINDAVPDIDQDILSGNVLFYSADRMYRSIALLRSKGISANGIELFDLVVLDVDNSEINKLLEEIPRIYQISISPDGNWIAFSTNEFSGQIYALRTSGIGEPIEIGHYVVEEDWEYSPISWTPDSRNVIWSDAGGLWISNPDEPQPQQILSDMIEIMDFQGENSEVRVMFTNLDWSPLGRYLLVTVKPYQSTVKWQGIIDTRRGHIAEVPGSYEFRNPAASANWGMNGDLIIANAGDSENDKPPSLKLFRVVSTRDDMLIPQEEYLFSVEDLTEAMGKTVVQNDLYFDLPIQINKWDYSIVLRTLENGSPPVLLMFDKKSGTLSAISELPYDTYSITWSPDGEHAVVLGQHGSVLSVLGENRQVFDLGAAWEVDYCCINWLPVDITGRWDDLEQIIEN